ncbi:MAG: LssY C-terminal domain-containing protein [Thiotrichales bacterium]|nr:MAG: LssY C-terminal domain-containing protein [Thiotrichales bacterium]
MIVAGTINRILASAVLAIVLAGCASKAPPSEKEKLGYKSRAESRSDGAVAVSASALSADESLEVYGVALAKRGIQPVWIEVENGDDLAYWLLFPGVDPNFFPASEAVEAFASEYKGEEMQTLERHFETLAFRNPVPPGKTVSGFVLVNLDEGAKMVHVDLVASGRHKSLSVFAIIPGFRADYHARQVFIRELFAQEEIVNYTDEQAFREALEALPCCVTNKDGTRNGDPLNLVIVGGQDDAFPALVRRGWRPTEQTWTGSVLKMVKSAMSGERYPYAPISPLYLYDRPQDFALQKARDNIHQRNHLRLWLSPMQYHGKQVWIGQISRDIGSRFTIHSPYLTTHKIDPDVDEARTALMEDMAYSQALIKLGLVQGVGAATKDSPGRNLTRDPYFTDGYRGVLMFDSHPTALTDIEFLSWESRERGFIEQSNRHKQQ